MATVVQATPGDLLDTIIRRYLKDDVTVKDYVPFVLDTITCHRLLNDRFINHDQSISIAKGTTVQQQSLSSSSSSSLATQQRIWAQRVRALLESPQPGARWAGVCFVRITAQQSVFMFTEHVKTWATLLVGMLNKYESTASLEMIIATLTELFAKTAKRPDLKSDVASKYLPDFHNNILNHKDKQELLPTIYKALAQSVTLFPTTFRLVVDKAEALCVAYMDGRFDLDQILVQEAANCFAALHYAGGKNPNHPTERILPSEQWRINVQELVKALHRCLNVLFETIDEDKVDQNEVAGKNKYLTAMPRPAGDPIQKYPQMIARFTSLSKGLMACLTCPTKEAVHLPLNSLVALLTRVYNVNTKTPMSEARGVDPQDYYLLISGILSLHMVSHQILTTLLASFQDHLVRYMSHLATIAIKSIRQSSSPRNSSSNSSTLFRISTYSVIETCIQAFGIPFVNMVQVPLMAALLEDLRMPSARTINPLEIGAGGSNTTNTIKHKGGAGKNRRGGAAGNNSSISGLGSPEEIVPSQVFIAALSVLSLVLTTAGPNLAPHARAAADTLVVTHLLNSQHHVNMIEQSETLFYTAAIRTELYKVLVASISSPAETQSSLVPLSVGIFKAGLNDAEKSVRDSCSMALTICDLVIHARLPPMQRARTTAVQPQKRLGEKPVKEAAETLFGEFQVPQNNFNDQNKPKNESSEEDEGEEVEEDEEEEEEGKDVEMKEEDMDRAASSSASMAAFKAAGDLGFKQPQPPATTVTTTTITTNISSASVHNKNEGDHQDKATVVGSSIKATRNVIESQSSTSLEDVASVTKTSFTSTTDATATTMTASSMLQSQAPESVIGVDGDEDEDFAIPEINMEDDDDDDDMGSE
ncbi:rRNA processing/ribosome biogenesis-domain-containing protein [Lobosporangium transversale]|uniref:Pre-rRNA-processing protein RIX1 n=1 Tax=Lobosporangium transversale TaxID=64571 RepID=A0A1Y2GGT5_9FUNG|nr:rRNA processing/ribosome biogenesis-domain-containing protein [Lobosporangium transversale]ORZ09110.1 rRNA processing/ribosome biogenesis-domain-containing protein [Lobosporangium transversale]|eukprot:XP_021878737.1 rRNA processing/ribosome biogenesis-domain-containing protein [Lobosporangium transversale]